MVVVFLNLISLSGLPVVQHTLAHEAHPCFMMQCRCNKHIATASTFLLQKPPHKLPPCIHCGQIYTSEFMSLTWFFDAFCCFCTSPLLAEDWSNFVSLFVILSVSLSSLWILFVSRKQFILFSKIRGEK